MREQADPQVWEVVDRFHRCVHIDRRHLSERVIDVVHPHGDVSLTPDAFEFRRGEYGNRCVRCEVPGERVVDGCAVDPFLKVLATLELDELMVEDVRPVRLGEQRLNDLYTHRSDVSGV